MPAQAELGRGTLMGGTVVMARGSRPWWNPTHRKVRDEWGTRLECKAGSAEVEADRAKHERENQGRRKSKVPSVGGS
jgi:hypothetical protein